MNALTRSIAVVMLCVMCLQINCVLVCFWLFAFNQKVIAETLCERKVKDCSGHCFLLKKIDAANDIQSDPSGKQVSTKTPEELLNAMPAILPKLQPAFQSISTVNKFVSDRASFLPGGETFQIDHPPKV